MLNFLLILGFYIYIYFLYFFLKFLLQIFVGNLDPNVTEEELKQIFSQFGELVYVKIPAGRGCGFVQFGTRFVQNVNHWLLVVQSI